MPSSIAATSSDESGLVMSTPETSPTNTGWICLIEIIAASPVVSEPEPPVLVPDLDDAGLALVAQDTDRRRAERQRAAVDRRQPDPTRAEDAKEVGVREQGDVA